MKVGVSVADGRKYAPERTTWARIALVSAKSVPDRMSETRKKCRFVGLASAASNLNQNGTTSMRLRVPQGKEYQVVVALFKAGDEFDAPDKEG